MKYIFVAGAPGSKWSSVIKNIYYSRSVDSSDYSNERTYWHSAWGKLELMHLGAYWDPGMEFGDFFDQLDQKTISQCEAEFNRPFTGNGIRIVKSHVFCHYLDFLSENWPDCPIVTVHREDNDCLDWWIECGQFDITYPNYRDYYLDLDHMKQHIASQNQDLKRWLESHTTKAVKTNVELCQFLGIDLPDIQYRQDYAECDVSVSVKI